MHSQNTVIPDTNTPHSPAHIRATWGGTGSVEDASRAFGFSRAKGYDLVRRGEFPCRVLRIGRSTRVVTASLLRVLESGEPEYSDAHAGRRRTPHRDDFPPVHSCGGTPAVTEPPAPGIIRTKMTKLGPC